MPITTTINTRTLDKLLIFLLLLPLIAGLPSAQASPHYSIPVNGRYSTLTIPIQIQQEPRWAHDVVVNATLVWNQAQKWFQENVQDGPVTVTFSLPAAYSSFAVAWTEYKFAPSSKTTITSAHVYLTETIFSQAQESNSTARQYAFRLALHELGHVLGLGHVLDGKDIMDPRAPAYLATQQTLISSLDLYAIHTLASGAGVSAFILLPSTVTYQLMDARTFLAT